MIAVIHRRGRTTPSTSGVGHSRDPKWSESIAIFVRLVPEMQIVTAIVSGVIWPKTINHPLTRLRRKPRDRERLGAALQVLIQTSLPFYRPVTTRVVYGKPLLASDLLVDRDPTAIMDAVKARARELIVYSKNPTQLK